MFNTYTMSEAARNSPGLVLIRNMIDHHARLGCTSFDFGVGTDDYKLQFCKDDRQPLFDSYRRAQREGTDCRTNAVDRNQPEAHDQAIA